MNKKSKTFFIYGLVITGNKEFDKRPHRSRFIRPTRTWTDQSYSPIRANVHPHATHASIGPPSTQPILHLDLFSHFCADYGTVSSFGIAYFSPKNCPFARTSEPHLTHASLGPSESTTKTASPLVRPFLHGSTAECCRTCRSMPRPPQNSLFHNGGS